MTLFNWFSGKSSPTKGGDDGAGSGQSGGRFASAASRPQNSAPPRPVADPTNRSEERKLKRHARREQLYQAVREAFTHAGVLSASYRFKVLSLDQTGNEFMVMMDVDQSFDHRAEKLADIEAKIVQTAQTHYEIRVTSVYWRVSLSAAPLPAKAAAPKPAQPAAVQSHDVINTSPKTTPNFRYDPIRDDEVAAFKQALVAASANSPVPANSAGKTRSQPRSYTLLTGFEDTEMPESASVPVLSATQYGDLN